MCRLGQAKRTQHIGIVGFRYALPNLQDFRMKDGECPVISWETQGGKVKDFFPGFYQLLESKLVDTQLARQLRSVSS